MFVLPMKLTYCSFQHGSFFSEDLVEKAHDQEAIRILASFPLPTTSSVSQGPTTSFGENELCMYTIHAYCIYLVTCIHKDKTMIMWTDQLAYQKMPTNANFCPYVVIAIIV